MKPLPDPKCVSKAGARASRRGAAATLPVRDLAPPRDVVPLPRPRTREEHYGTELERSA
jgi:hypothetical protein